eukprot:1670899-Pyramimonas_sp.AAC.1
MALKGASFSISATSSAAATDANPARGGRRGVARGSLSGRSCDESHRGSSTGMKSIASDNKRFG